MTTRIRLALYQPDIPQNAGNMMRTGACLGVGIDVIEPAGFVFSDRRLRRAGLDYLAHADIVRHESWRAFLSARSDRRLILLSAEGACRYVDFSFRSDDVLVLGRESAGAPEEVRRAVAARIAIPMRAGMRSLNVAVAAGMVLGEALRQTGGFLR